MNIVSRSLVLAALLLAASHAAADEASLPTGASEARLAAPSAGPRQAIVDGRVWRCSADVCAAARQDGAASLPLWMECAHVAAVFGSFSTYATGPKRLEPDKLARCNAKAKAA